MSLKNNQPMLAPASITNVTLDAIQLEMKAWRASKKTRSEKIPSMLWDKIFDLLSKGEDKSRLLQSLWITRDQLRTEENRREELLKKAMVTPSNTVTFCPVQQVVSETRPSFVISSEATEPPTKTTVPLAYTPAKTFNTTTSVVEIYRADGHCMKIHLCTERFEELLAAFLKG